jgi:hypothetical protein
MKAANSSSNSNSKTVGRSTANAGAVIITDSRSQLMHVVLAFPLRGACWACLLASCV